MTAATSVAPDTGQDRDLPPSMVERMTLIMDAFDRRNRRRTLEEIARSTSLPRSTTHRILNQLVRLGWLDHEPSGYCLGWRALNLGGRDGGHGEIREAAAGVLHDLQTRTGLVVHLAVLDGAEVFYLDKVGGKSAGAVPSRVGGRAPAHSTALGKAMLAVLEPEQVDVRLRGHLERVTGRTIDDLTTMHQELNRVRQRRGLAFERAECVPGIACVAAPVDAPDGPPAALSVVADPNTALEAVAPLVLQAARRVCAELRTPAEAASVNQVAGNRQNWPSHTLDRLVATSGRGWGP